LVIPLKRGQKSPEHTARGVMIGVGWAMTPTVGIQMPLVFAHWFLSRRLFGWDFSLINGLAWTWLSNVFTLLPIYYLFFLTGQVMLGRMDDLTGYEGFLKLMGGASDVSLGDWESMRGWFEVIIEGWGVSMLVGCVPWTIFSGWVAYIWSLAFVRNYRAKRLGRKAHARTASSD
jgi:uncharacterized protein (DUF2062 family)